MFGIVASLVGSAIGTWWLINQRRLRRAGLPTPRDHGTVIFDNSPTAAEIDAIL